MSLTVIIASKNEGDNLKETLRSIRNTQDERVEILIINDASTDGYDYDAIAQEFDSRIIHNKISLGVGGARHLGISTVTTENILIIDGHMRFRRDKWVSKINEAIRDNPRSVMCCCCGYLDEKLLSTDRDSQEKIDSSLHTHGFMGADINLLSGPRARWLPKSYWETVKDKKYHPIPTVMGASYCMSVKWYNYIGGLKYLNSWGQDEQLLSWKSWRLGGDSKIILDVWIGHIWNTRRAGISFETPELHKNQYITILLGIPEPFRSECLTYMNARDKDKKGWNLVKDNMEELKIEIDRIDSIDTHNVNFSKLLACNRDIVGSTPSNPKFNFQSIKSPSITVILPVYNHNCLNGLQKAINSFVLQNYINKELLIINGLSDSKIKLDNLSLNIRIQNTVKNIDSVASLLNIGLALSNSDFVTFLEPNDYILPNYLNHSVHNSNKKAFILKGFVGHYSDGKPLLKVDFNYISMFLHKDIYKSDKCFKDSSDPYKEYANSIVNMTTLDLGYNLYCSGLGMKSNKTQDLILTSDVHSRSEIFKDLENLKWV